METGFIKENITAIKYGLIIINIFFMIIAIKAVVNYQTIVSSIDLVQQNIEKTQEHTDYINNFLTPYLNSEYAQYFLAHENNQLLDGETIVKIVIVSSGSLVSGSGSHLSGSTHQTYRANPSQSRQAFIKKLIDDIVWKR